MCDPVLAKRNELLQKYGCIHCVPVQSLTEVELTEPFCSVVCVYMEGVLKEMRGSVRYIPLILITESVIAKLRTIITHKLLLTADSLSHDRKATFMSASIKVAITHVCMTVCLAKHPVFIVRLPATDGYLHDSLKCLSKAINDLFAYLSEAGYRGSSDDLSNILTNDEMKLYNNLISTHEHHTDSSPKDQMSVNVFEESVQFDLFVCNLLENVYEDIKGRGVEDFNLKMSSTRFIGYLHYIISSKLLNSLTSHSESKLNAKAAELKEMIVRISNAIIYNLYRRSSISLIDRWIDEFWALVESSVFEIYNTGDIEKFNNDDTVTRLADQELCGFLIEAYKSRQ
jgi:hypothetical protein